MNMDLSPSLSSTENGSSTESLTDAQVDGPINPTSPDMQRRPRLAGDVCAIFVHAGAGYHSIQNEKVHLAACEDAARSAMTFLNNGATAVEAVELAIKVLEDKEITNAGFGSNLAMDGTVECDATIVDHYGRSGAVGAAGCIRNPIHLARLILEHSTKPLSLRRVPPNLLVGPGATDFAHEAGMTIVNPDFLVSAAAGERYARWTADLNRVGLKDDSDSDHESQTTNSRIESYGPVNSEADSVELAGCWNESQPFSPRTSASKPTEVDTRVAAGAVAEATPRRDFWSSNEPGNDGQSSIKVRDEDEDSSIDDGPCPLRRKATTHPRFEASSNSSSDLRDYSEDGGCKLPAPLIKPPPTRAATPSSFMNPRLSGHNRTFEDTMNGASRPDDITDTVGAIAVDCFGNIAAGSSSGGIGMKHKGRVGPAALVGIGTAVIPSEPEDKEKTSVGTVTSGTGEHMATTMAAGTCASRLYTSSRRNKRGGSEPTDDDNAIRAFVERDFMGHPSVKYSHSAGAIGILGIKKTVDGVCLYFAHNTDSFAVASMSTNDREPRSVMSRGKGDGHVVHGARMIKHRRWSSPHRGTWPVNPDEHRDPDPSPPPPSKRQRTKRVIKETKEKAFAPESSVLRNPRPTIQSPVYYTDASGASSAGMAPGVRSALIAGAASNSDGTASSSYEASSSS